MDVNKAHREQLERAFQVDGQRAEYIERFTSLEDKMIEHLEEAGFMLGKVG